MRGMPRSQESSRSSSVSRRFLRLRLLSLERVLGPDALRVGELSLPGLDVAEQVGDELLLVVGHAAAEVRHPGVRLHAVLQVTLGDEDVSHGEHAETANLLRRVKPPEGTSRASSS